MTEENPKDALKAAVAQNRRILGLEPQLPTPLERKCQEIIEYIWSGWYGKERGVMNAEQMADLLTSAKNKIMNLVDAEPYKPKTEGEMVEMLMNEYGMNEKLARGCASDCAGYGAFDPEYSEPSEEEKKEAINLMVKAYVEAYYAEPDVFESMVDAYYALLTKFKIIRAE